MKIGFNGRPFCQSGIRGLGRHTLELIKALKKLHPENEFYIYSYETIDPIYKEQLPFAHFRDKKVRPKILWDLFLLGREIRQDKLDVFHSTNNLGVPVFSAVPLAVTIHDTFTHRSRLPWRMPHNWWGALVYRLEYFATRNAAIFFTVSQVAKDEIHQEMMLQKSKIVVTYNGCHFQPLSSPTEKSEYFLYVGGLEARKNIKVMLEAIAKYNSGRKQVQPLVLVGSSHSAPLEVMQMIEAHPILFQLVEAIDDARLSDYYAKAKALIFPSLAEGFGLPLIEAMRCGCPVVVSNIKVFREIAQESALYFSPHDPEELRLTLELLDKEPALWKKMILSGKQRSDDFTWEKMAEKTYDEYLKIVR